jgi:imidazolonepropionase-like amidohydrolase
MAGYGRCVDEEAPEAEGARRHLDHQLNQIARARSLGVELALGTDAGSPGVRHGRGMVVEMELMGIAGFSIAETVRYAAVNGARLLGLERSGELRVGSPADFVLVSGTPEDLPGSLERVNAVVVAGRVVYEATPNTF